MRAAMRCPQCGAAVLWTVTEAGKRLLIDAHPDDDGNTAVYRDGTGTHRSRRPSVELPLMGWEKLHKPHVATCTGRRPAAASSLPASLPAGVADLSAYRRKNRGRP
ncbi:hypothetical protein [Streptomyces sulphureus]|uniref:hypothetical protein n=1 Tax=Streptomyces sulphureus TaxID=47758 RepID=UPI000368DA34|nr:hypothetical protein [Streptomyces sulphureus]